MTEPPKLEDLDPVETREWLESIDSVLKTHGPERAHFLLENLIARLVKALGNIRFARLLFVYQLRHNAGAT